MENAKTPDIQALFAKLPGFSAIAFPPFIPDVSSVRIRAKRVAGVFSYEIITRYTYGSVVNEIDDNHVRQIAIPLLKNKDIQKRINDLALEANEKRYEAYKRS